ncbi:MAG: glycosyltransferase family 2 protein [Acetobacteraceae bacterium]|nr:glycosyltransferase family 2 protein [Acetobacteraceae bacterium]
MRGRPALHGRLRRLAGPALRALARRGVRLWGTSSYASWVRAHGTLSAADRDAIARLVAAWPDPPVFGLVLAEEGALQQLIAQPYPRWEAALAAGRAASDEPRLRPLPELGGGWVLFLGPGDRLAEGALAELAVAARAHPDAAILYGDEDRLDQAGHRTAPCFKPRFDPELLRAGLLPGRAFAIRRDLLPARLEAAPDVGWLLDLHDRLGGAAFRHVPATLLHRASPDAEAGTVLAALKARGLPAEARGEGPPRLRWPLPDPAPLVSVIIPTRDRGELLGPCLEGLLRRTDHPALEILVADNGTEQPLALAVLHRAAQDPRVRVLRMDGPFNFSRLNNHAAAAARGDILLLLNNDTEVLHPDWLTEMAAQASRPGIGAVGAKLLYPDGTVQHAGVLLGTGWPGGVAGHLYPGAGQDDPGPWDQLRVVRSVSAVTAACLAVRRELFLGVGGFDEEALAVAFNDVDLCLKLQARGLRNLWTPHAVLLHKESASRGDDMTGERRDRFWREVAVMRERWGDVLDDDPYWNPNLSLATGAREVADAPRRRPPWR